MPSPPVHSPSDARRRAGAYHPADDWDDNDDDDMDYEPAGTSQDESSDAIVEFLDAPEGLDGDESEIMLALEEEENGELDLDQGAERAGSGMLRMNRPVIPPGAQVVHITSNELLQLLGNAGLRQIFYNHGRGSQQVHDDDEEEEESEPEAGYAGIRRRRRRARTSDRFPKVPSDEGRELMDSGVFGTSERLEGQFKRKKKLAASIMRRELGLGSAGSQRNAGRIASQGMIPSTSADCIIHYDSKCYSGQFSDDGNFFFACAQDFKVRMYDTSNPYQWKYYKTVDYLWGQWTITDASLSPDNRFLAYSSIRSLVYLAPTDPNEESQPYELEFSELAGRGRRGAHYSHSHFGIWSIRFSGDGREIVAGTSDRSVYVYDIESRQSVLRIPGHEDDVNAVCFGDQSSPHILYSGSDDTTLKVWDRRSMGDGREAGVFLGHTEGLTYVDSKGDGRYVLSNGKDQTMKLWDLRKMMSTEKSDKIDVGKYSTGFDYRFMSYDDDDYRPHPHDCSLVTFRGHKVLKTLIRCHFSPPGSTDSRYVYSGSEDGSVYIYNLDATLAGKIDVNRATRNSRPRLSPDAIMETYDERRSGGQWKTCVRDASWHPFAPVIAATSWNGWGMSSGTCTIHSWNDGLEADEGDPEMSLRVDAKLQHDQSLYGHSRTVPSHRPHTRSMRSLIRSRLLDDDDDN